MINAVVTENLSDANYTFDSYAKLTRKSRPDSLAYFARNVAGYSVREMKKQMIAKGGIRNERLAALKSGSGIKVSQRARDLVASQYGVVERNGRKYMVGSRISKAKGSEGDLRGFSKSEGEKIARLNKVTGGALTIHALAAEKEIQLREGHRAFTTSAFLFPGMMGKNKAGERTRYYSAAHGFKIGVAFPVDRGLEADEFHFQWGGLGLASNQAAIGIRSKKGQEALAKGLQGARANMLQYIYRKQDEAARNAARSIR